MRQNSNASGELLDDLAAFLDCRTDQMRRTLERLDQLRAAVIRRDERAMAEMLEQTRQESQLRDELDAVQVALGQRLAAAFGLTEPVNLTRLCAALDAEQAERFRQKQRTLLELAERVRLEHSAAEMLLRECARCNRLLLDAIVGRSAQHNTYDPQGQARRSMNGSLVNVRY